MGFGHVTSQEDIDITNWIKERISDIPEYIRKMYKENVENLIDGYTLKSLNFFTKPPIIYTLAHDLASSYKSKRLNELYAKYFEEVMLPEAREAYENPDSSWGLSIKEACAEENCTFDELMQKEKKEGPIDESFSRRYHMLVGELCIIEAKNLLEQMVKDGRIVFTNVHIDRTSYDVGYGIK